MTSETRIAVAGPPANGFLAILAAHRATVLLKARSSELDGRTRASTRPDHRDHSGDSRHHARCLTRHVDARAARARGALNQLDHPVRPLTATSWAMSASIDKSIRSNAMMAAR